MFKPHYLPVGGASLTIVHLVYGFTNAMGQSCGISTLLIWCKLGQDLYMLHAPIFNRIIPLISTVLLAVVETVTFCSNTDVVSSPNIEQFVLVYTESKLWSASCQLTLQFTSVHK